MYTYVLKRMQGMFGLVFLVSVLSACNDNELSSTSNNIVLSKQQWLEVSITNGNDDAEERSNGSMYLNSSDLDLITDGNDQQTVGLRFTGVNIPVGSTIGRAYLQFETDEASSLETTLSIVGQDEGSAATFNSASNNISNRPRTNALVNWIPSAWISLNERGTEQQSVDLSVIVQEIINRTDWGSDSLVFIITGTGSRVAKSFENNGGVSLHIEYIEGNPPPTITLKGTSPIKVEQGGRYDELGATANDYNGQSLDVTTTGNVDTKRLGTYLLTYSARDSEGKTSSITRTAIVTPPAGNLQMLEVSIANDNDNAEERSDGSMYLNSSDLELVTAANVQNVGLRFTGVNIPVGSNISRAYLQFETNETTSLATILSIAGQNEGSTATFNRVSNNISNRPRTRAVVNWMPSTRTAIKEHDIKQQSADLSVIVQEIINRTDWGSDSLAFIITGIGSRVAKSFKNNGAVSLHIEYMRRNPASYDDFTGYFPH